MKTSVQTASRFLAAGLACVTVLMADAREPTQFPNRRVDDSTGVVWIKRDLRPLIDTTPAPTGATLLPYTMPPGNYFNSASYPLLLTVSPPGPSCYDFSVYVNGQFIARARDDCEQSNTSVTVLVPANNSFGITGGNTRVTAMANDATWASTKISFLAPIRTYRVDHGTSGCINYATIYTDSVESITGKIVTTGVDDSSDNCTYLQGIPDGGL